MTKLITYKSDIFIGKEIQIDEDFLTSLKLIEDYARFNSLQIYITQAVRNSNAVVSGAIVKPATKSNHLVGHAIDMNIQFKNNLYNSDDLAKDNLFKLPNEIQYFINGVRKNDTLRWGGDFDTPDPVHIDDALNLRNPELWEEKYYFIQGELNGIGNRTLFLTQPMMTGDDVLQLQKLLNLANYFMYADGIFGNDTDKAVRAFQADNKLSVDGIVGDNTKKLLGLI